MTLVKAAVEEDTSGVPPGGGSIYIRAQELNFELQSSRWTNVDLAAGLPDGSTPPPKPAEEERPRTLCLHGTGA